MSKKLSYTKTKEDYDGKIIFKHHLNKEVKYFCEKMTRQNANKENLNSFSHHLIPP
jgi:hypothetical protein